jgi:lipopolysaccharide/colanic/teichoic acid biosynthesis glycosyltransferase
VNRTDITTATATELAPSGRVLLCTDDAATLAAPTAAPYITVDVPWRATSAVNSFYLRCGKRLLDIVGATVGLVLTAPILFIAAIMIKLDSEGPVFYKQERLGYKHRPFMFFKLRSMYDGAHDHRHKILHLNEVDGPVFKISNDPRVTRVGRFIRRTSIDELPQLFNVLRGDMSLVGPRPPIAEEVAKYEPWQRRRLDVKPGVSCLWQIGGRSTVGFDEWMRLDMEYIRRQSFALDVKILLRTLPAVLAGKGAF